MDTGTFMLRLVIALILGAALGFDREIKGAPVGVRTFSLVSLGSAAYIMLALRLLQIEALENEASIDPSRIIQGLIGGIGFLGAGAVIGGMSDDNKVRGIATGAAIWIAGAIGAACGLGFYWEAGGICVAAISILILTEFGQLLFGNRDKVVRDSDDKK